MLRDLLRFFLAQLLHRIKKSQGAIALAGTGEIEGGLHQRIEPFRQSNPIKGGGAGFHHHDPLGISQADVFPGRNQQAPEDEAGIFAGFHHACQPKQGGIGITAANRFDEGADGVEMGIALLVVENGLLLDRLLSDRQGDLNRS